MDNKLPSKAVVSTEDEFLWLQNFLIAGGILILLFSVMVIVEELVRLLWRMSQDIVTSIGIITLLSGVTLVISLAIAQEFKRRKNKRDQFFEQVVLKAIIAKELGSTSIPLIASLAEISLEQAKETLDSLHSKGYCKIQITEDGDFSYCFPFVLESKNQVNSKNEME